MAAHALSAPGEPGAPPRPELSRGRTWALGVATFLLMLPETLPVPVLKGLVVDRFAVSAGLATLFLAANMIGGLITAPLAGLFVDRTGRRRRLCLLALALDALAMQALAHPLDYATFLMLRVGEGALHLTALTLLMSLTADAAGQHRGRALGAVGCGLTLGVATGAALGGQLGKHDPLLTLHVASAVLLAAVALAARALPADTAPGARPGYGELVAAVRAEPRLWAPLALAFVDRFTVGFFTAGFPLLLGGVHHVAAPQIGMLLAAFLYPFGLLSYAFGRAAEHRSRARMVAAGSLVYGVAVALVGSVPVPWLWLVMPACGVASAVMFVPTLLWLYERAPGVGRSTLMASFHAAGSLGFLLGPLVCGRIVDGAGGSGGGYALAFAVAGASEIAGALLVVLTMVRRRR